MCTSTVVSVNFVHELMRHVSPFRYYVLPAPERLCTSSGTWSNSFSDDGGILDSGSGIRIEVGKSKGHSCRKQSSRTIKAKLVDDVQHTNDHQVVMSPTVELKLTNFTGGDNITIHLPVSVKINGDTESQNNTEISVYCQTGSRHHLEEIERNLWQYEPEDSVISIRTMIRNPNKTLKMIFCAVVRTVRGQIYKYIQLGVNVRLYGPQHIQKNMTLHSIFTFKSVFLATDLDNVPHPVSPAALIPWRDLHFYIKRPQVMRLQLAIQGESKHFWEYPKKLKAISMDEMRSPHPVITRDIPLSYRVDSTKMEPFNLTLTMELDEESHDLSCTTPTIGLTTPLNVFEETQPATEQRRSSFSKNSSRRHDEHKLYSSRLHEKCAVCHPEVRVPATILKAKKDSTERENLLSFKKGDLIAEISSPHLRAWRAGKHHKWDVGCTQNGVFGFFAKDHTELFSGEGIVPYCITGNILNFVAMVCRQLSDYDNHAIKAQFRKLGSKWKELAWASEMETTEIDAIVENDPHNVTVQAYRLADRILSVEGKVKYLSTIVSGLYKIGLPRMALNIVRDALLNTIAKATLPQYDAFYKTLDGVFAEGKSLSSSSHFYSYQSIDESESEMVKNSVEKLKSYFLSQGRHAIQVLECLKKALGHKDFKSAEFENCEFLTEKVMMIYFLETYLCSCKTEDLQIF
ncbi:SH3 domain-binding protein 4-like [Saccoglossus kowalevskii]|uniref:Uncharacterized protein LOC102801087 n=1 Tax=Saccoglossus kowalevskii TaxID=10224 RepID=A0ABM0MFX7_SACKO|nr:PREDICTED: uncharacterized protein LOC102801087 [Saccoglossus kowalevskii]